jgi:flagellar biosynthesis/type III secretory pathway protein FliH
MLYVANIRISFEFICHYAHFTNSDFSAKFEHKIELITQPNDPMGIHETILEEVKKQGIAIGEAKSIQRAFEEGIKKGIKIGIKIGADRALKYVIAQLLQKGFSTEETVVLLNVTQEKVIEVVSELAAGIVPTLPDGEQMINPS